MVYATVRRGGMENESEEQDSERDESDMAGQTPAVCLFKINYCLLWQVLFIHTTFFILSTLT